MAITTSDQDRRIEDRSIELGADAVEVAAIGPAGVGAVLARYTGTADGNDRLERILPDGTPAPVEGFKKPPAPRWLRYAGPIVSAIVALVVAAAPASAALEPLPPIPPIVYGDSSPCTSGRASTCAVAGVAIYTSLDRLPRATWLHELGHFFDYALGDGPAGAGVRARFQRIMGDPGPWRTPANAPIELFAESYGWCARRGPRQIPRDRLYWLYGRRAPVRGTELRAACGLIARAGQAAPFTPPAASVWAHVKR